VDDITAVDDAILEDMVHCRYCGSSWDVLEVTLYGDVAICDDCADQDLAGLVVQVVRLRDALDFYADASRYDYRKVANGPWLQPSLIGQDRGKIARAALNPEGAPS
jgi:hypothetical protein